MDYETAMETLERIETEKALVMAALSNVKNTGIAAHEDFAKEWRSVPLNAQR